MFLVLSLPLGSTGNDQLTYSTYTLVMVQNPAMGFEPNIILEDAPTHPKQHINEIFFDKY